MGVLGCWIKRPAGIMNFFNSFSLYSISSVHLRFCPLASSQQVDPPDIQSIFHALRRPSIDPLQVGSQDLIAPFTHLPFLQELLPFLGAQGDGDIALALAVPRVEHFGTPFWDPNSVFDRRSTDGLPGLNVWCRVGGP